MAQGAEREYAEEIPPQDMAGLNDGEEGSTVTAAVPLDNVAFVGSLLEEAARQIVHLGGVVTIAAERVEYEQGKFGTQRLVFRWDSWGGPAVKRLPREEAKAEPSPEPVEKVAVSNGNEG